MMPHAPIPIEVFCSYAHADEPLLQQLEAHLSVPKHQGLISTWYDRQIVPGTDWAHAIDTHLNSASIILLLISSNFLASDYCLGIEAKRALERHQANEARVIPILLRAVDWKDAPFAHLQALPTNARPITSWSDQDAAFADVTAGIRRAIEDLSLVPMSIAQTALPSIWNIPYPRNPVFTGREEILTQLADALKIEQRAVLSQPQAISGLGGIGKTQIAVEYAYRYAKHYQAVLWVRSSTREELISGFVALADLLQLPQKEKKEQLVIVQAVSEWLKTHERWLLILDNADDLALVREFLPPAHSGHILLTTRAQAMGRLASRIEVTTMPHDIGTLFLLRRASLIALHAPLDHANDSDIATARAICEELGGLPLALDQAGAYIEETQCNLSDYQRLYRTRRSKLLNKRGGLVDDHPESVATSWSLSFQKVEQTDPAAAELLRYCAFLHPDAIPEEIITAGAEHLGPLLQVVALDPLALNKGLKNY